MHFAASLVFDNDYSGRDASGKLRLLYFFLDGTGCVLIMQGSCLD
jgi:hypothetical protein